MNREPQSPMKIEAGLELYNRKPTRTAANIASNWASCRGRPQVGGQKPRAIAATPAPTVHVVQQV